MNAPRRMAWLLAASALAGASLGEAARAQRLGRLFTTPEERANLDDIRYQSQFARAEPEPAPAPAPGAVVEPEPTGPAITRLTINGVVRSSGGPATVWLNGDQVERGLPSREGLQVEMSGRRRDSVRIVLPSGADTVDLKPGQQIDVLDGTVLEAYERGPQAHGRTAFAPAAERAAGDAEAPAPAVPEAPAAGATPTDAGAGASASPVAPTGVARQLTEQQRQHLLEEVRRAVSPVPAAPPGTAPGS